MSDLIERLRFLKGVGDDAADALESQAARIKELEAMVQHEWASVGLCIISIDRLQELESSLAAAIAGREAAERDAGRLRVDAANLKTIFRVQALRHIPDVTHTQIDAAIANACRGVAI